MSDASPPRDRQGPLKSGREAFGGAYLRADRILDRGQHNVFRVFWLFLPDTSIVRDTRFQAILVSRFFSDAGQQAMTYGALIAVVRGGGSTIQAALVGAAALLPPALFGLYGGAVADALPKRVALALMYNLQAALCFIIPFFAGTELLPVLLLIFGVHTLGQISGPTESSVVPLVASQRQLASAASLVSLASSVGTAFGTALLAPLLVRLFDEEVVFYTAGAMLLIAASRVFDLPTRQNLRPMNWRRPKVDVWATVRWLAHERAVATMIFVGVLVGVVSTVIQVLAPRYVQSVIGVDPADAVYVFAPSTIGLVAGLAAAPKMIRRIGERNVALAGFVLASATLCLIGLNNQGLASIIDPINPMRLLRLVDISLNPRLRTAGALAIPLGFALAATTTAVQTYINRRVPISYQGRAFALQGTLKNGAAIIPLLSLGAASEVFGVSNVLIASPIVLLVLAAVLVRLSFVFSGHTPGSRFDVLSSFWQESEDPVLDPEALTDDGDGASFDVPVPEAETADDGEHQRA